MHIKIKRIAWADAFPNQLLDVSYESLASEPEREIRRILDFLALAWEPNCLNFFLNASSVRTFSKDQVRSRVNTGQHQFDWPLA